MVEYYKDKAGRWRWRAIARNGRIVADSGQGYKTLWGAKGGKMAAYVAITSEQEKVVRWPDLKP